MANPLEGFDPDDHNTDGDGIFGLPHTLDQAKVVVIPVPFEATTTFGHGTSRAPGRIEEASTQVELNDTWTGEPWRAGIAMQPVDAKVVAWNDEACRLARPIVAAGGAHHDAHRTDQAAVNRIGDQVNDWVREQTRARLDRGQIPAILGGDHSVSFGAIAAAAEAHPGLGILHIDAHADLRNAYQGFTWSHASIFHNVRERIAGLGQIVQVGLRDIGRSEAQRIEAWDNLRAYTDQEIAWEVASGEPFMRIAARILRPLPKAVWVSFDIDGLEPSNCPRTGTPVPGGLSWDQALLLLQLLAADHRIVGFDLVEVGDGDWDANVGARLLYKLSGWAIQTSV